MAPWRVLVIVAAAAMLWAAPAVADPIPLPSGLAQGTPAGAPPTPWARPAVAVPHAVDPPTQPARPEANPAGAATPQTRPHSRAHVKYGVAASNLAASTEEQAPEAESPQTAGSLGVGLTAVQKEAVGHFQEGEFASRSEVDQLRRQEAAGRRILVILGIILGILILVAIALMIVFWVRARAWNRRFQESVEQARETASKLEEIEQARRRAKGRLPALLEQIGDQPLSFEEEGPPFSGKALALLDEVDALAYEGDSECAFSNFSDPSEATVYLNGLLLSAAARVSPGSARSGWDSLKAPGSHAAGLGNSANPANPWVALARLNRFFNLLASAPRAVGTHRIAQAYSYRALAGYRILEMQDWKPSWQRRAERSNTGEISRQSFADIAEAARLDPEWKHTLLVEALLSSRFYTSGGAADGTRAELELRGLKRAAELLKQLIDGHSYRGPARRRLARTMKQIAEHTGEKGDFSDFGFLLNSFPTDEELADEALAARQPESQDRFLWQWLLGDCELFGSLERLNAAEYRSFWVRLLDSKVHLRNWRADLEDLRRKNPAMREWAVQLLHAEAPISLAGSPSRRQDYFETPFSGT